MRRLRAGLAGRLFAAQALVVLAGGITSAVVAAAVGPPIFRDHLRQAAGAVSPQADRHVEDAYTSASALSFGVALIAALAAALTVSAYVARRLGRSVGELAQASTEIADGRYQVRAAPPGLGAEFDTLAASFNAMALRLESVEATRRRLLADLGHEMRTPLATIEGYLDAAEDGVSVEDEDVLTVLRAQTARLRRLSDDIAAVSRAEEHQLDLHPVPTPPAVLVADAVAAARARATAAGIALRDRVEPGLPTVLVDPHRMGQVLGNLLDNALRHTPAGGSVEVRAWRTGGQVHLAVADTGPGIPAEHLPHVFERFYRADRARDRQHGGSGIGLAIARAIVTAHNGQIHATPTTPHGATLTITLPVTTSP
jgi:two-component system sensor histidine kinase BaeS